MGESTAPGMWQTFCLSTWRPPLGPMSFAPMAVSSKIDRVYHNLSKSISFWPFFWLTFKWTHPQLKDEDTKTEFTFQTTFLLIPLRLQFFGWLRSRFATHLTNNFRSNSGTGGTLSCTSGSFSYLLFALPRNQVWNWRVAAPEKLIFLYMPEQEQIIKRRR